MGTTLLLLADAAGGRVVGHDVDVSGIALDSRRVEPGYLFAALPGTSADGRAFVQDAIARGASALLVPEELAEAGDLPQLVAPDARATAGRCAHLLAGSPGSSLQLVGVTGTNGKTTTTWLVRELLQSDAAPFGCFGTVAFDTGRNVHASTHTTPDPIVLARLLKEASERGSVGVALEVSSHALDQDRVAGLTFHGAVFTNLTRDHLDYHGTMASYAGAKLRLLDLLSADAPVIFPSDDPWLAPAFAGRPAALSFGWNTTADVQIVDTAYSPDGTDIDLETPIGSLRLRSPLLGAFNVSNVAAAVALGIALGRSGEVLAERLQRFAGVPGRLQRVGPPTGPTVIVDYAHTPDAVEKVLDACRGFCSGRLMAVLGAGGDRDAGKRPQMARAAQRRTDLVVLTSDNPRSEDPEEILDDVERGLIQGDAPWVRMADRTQAIRHAIAVSRDEDCVAILGKGHETYQEIQGSRLPFSDVDVARDALEADSRG